MLADPRGGDVYRQEFYAGEAEDLAVVRHVENGVKVPAGTYDDVLVTEEWTPLEPNVIELKYYARGVGVIAERRSSGARTFRAGQGDARPVKGGDRACRGPRATSAAAYPRRDGSRRWPPGKP